LCAVYCADGTQINEPTKYVATTLTSISTMMQMSVPHLNVLTKCDKVNDKQLLEKLTGSMSCQELMDDLGHSEEKKLFFTERFFKLNQALVGVIDTYSMVHFLCVDIQDEESLQHVVMQIDQLVQYDDYRMPNDKHFLD
jgi:hypothetical protein